MPIQKVPTLSPDEIDLLLEFIARDHLMIDTLEVRHRDGLDFHEVGVASLKSALLAAFDAGRRADRRLASRRRTNFGPVTPAARAVFVPSVMM
jgi:hypothetical protein